VAQSWGAGLWGLLAFAMQMCLVMLTGYVVAVSPLFARALDALARVPRGPRGAVAWMAFLSMTLGLLNRGVSIVGSAVRARALARQRRDVDHRLLVAAAYLGLGCTWHAWLSALAPMTVAAPHNDFVAAGFLSAPVPSAATIGSAFNLALAVIVVAVMTALVAALHPRREDAYVVDPELLAEPHDDEGEAPGGFIDRALLGHPAAGRGAPRLPRHRRLLRGLLPRLRRAGQRGVHDRVLEKTGGRRYEHGPRVTPLRQRHPASGRLRREVCHEGSPRRTGRRARGRSLRRRREGRHTVCRLDRLLRLDVPVRDAARMAMAAGEGRDEVLLLRRPP
jgi:hypothetical protein